MDVIEFQLIAKANVNTNQRFFFVKEMNQFLKSRLQFVYYISIVGFHNWYNNNCIWQAESSVCTAL